MLFDPILTVKDFLLGPVYALLLILVARAWRNAFYKNSEIKPYFLPALIVRFTGAVLSAAMYQYYYHGGDTFRYFRGAEAIYKLFLTDPILAIVQLFSRTYVHTEVDLHFLELDAINKSVLLVEQIGGVLSWFTFGTYLPISLIFTFFGFIGCWCLFLTFYKLYPHLHRPLAIACLFIPSVFFWGTGLMKEPLVLGGLGVLVYHAHRFFIEKKGGLLSLILVGLSAWIIIRIKIYVLLAFLPALLVWLFLENLKKLASLRLKILLLPLGFSLIFLLAGGLVWRIGQLEKKYSVTRVLERASITQKYILRISRESGGSYYDLGEFEPTFQGALVFFPKAVNVTLFRPYPWEARKLINIPAAVESFFTLIFTLWVIFRIGVVQSLRRLTASPLALFCLVFALVFAFASGLTSSNFGALARYKIPLLPFYFSALIILLHPKDASLS